MANQGYYSGAELRHVRGFKNRAEMDDWLLGTGDFNNDGYRDILWRDTGGNTAIWLMKGASVLALGGLGNVPTTWSMVQTGDYNADGKSDLLWRDMSGNTAIWFMNGTQVASTAGVGNIPTKLDGPICQFR